MFTTRVLLNSCAALIPVLATATVLAADPATPVASTAIHRTVSWDGYSTEIAVDTADNPLMLMQTSMGNIVVELFAQEAPQTVANFLELAGNKPATDAETTSQSPPPFYDGLSFHRVVDGFMIQAGSPDGTRDANAGVHGKDEISATSLGLDKMLVLDASGVPNAVLGIRSQQDFQQRVLAPVYKSMSISSQPQLDARIGEAEQHLRTLSVMALYEMQGFHYRNELQSHAPVRGVIAMANHGPDSNGSQFFINLVDTPWLTGKHTVFGKVRLGMEVVDAIGKVKVDTDARPLQAVTLLSVHPL